MMIALENSPISSSQSNVLYDKRLSRISLSILLLLLLLLIIIL